MSTYINISNRNLDSPYNSYIAHNQYDIKDIRLNGEIDDRHASFGQYSESYVVFLRLGGSQLLNCIKKHEFEWADEESNTNIKHCSPFRAIKLHVNVSKQQSCHSLNALTAIPH